MEGYHPRFYENRDADPVDLSGPQQACARAFTAIYGMSTGSYKDTSATKIFIYAKQAVQDIPNDRIMGDTLKDTYDALITMVTDEFQDEMSAALLFDSIGSHDWKGLELVSQIIINLILWTDCPTYSPNVKAVVEVFNRKNRWRRFIPLRVTMSVIRGIGAHLLLPQNKALFDKELTNLMKCQGKQNMDAFEVCKNMYKEKEDIRVQVLLQDAWGKVEKYRHK